MGIMLKLVPVSHSLFGADFPFSSAETVAEGLSEVGLKASDLQSIERENAPELFPRPKNAKSQQ
jgi:predicted TIM-barrel fold metal-dependent hydrolase